MLIFIGLEARISTPLHQGSFQRRNPRIITRDLYTFYHPVWFGFILLTRTTATLLQDPKASILALVATLIPQFISVRVGIDLGLIRLKGQSPAKVSSVYPWTGLEISKYSLSRDLRTRRDSNPRPRAGNWAESHGTVFFPVWRVWVRCDRCFSSSRSTCGIVVVVVIAWFNNNNNRGFIYFYSQ